MRQWSYPAGTVINGQALVQAAILPAQEFILDGWRHGPEIFELWTLEALAELGLTPVDVPDPQPDPRDAIQMQIVDLEALQTPRLVREAIQQKQTIINDASSPLNGMTPSEAIAYIDVQVSALRAQLA